MPRDEVDVRNIVPFKRVSRVAQRLLDPLNGADAANAARLSTEQSLNAVDQGQTATLDALPDSAQVVPLKQQALDALPEQAVRLKRHTHVNEVEDDYGKRCSFPVFLSSPAFHSLLFQPQNRHVRVHLPPVPAAPPLHLFILQPSRTLKMKMGLHLHQVRGIGIAISDSTLTIYQPAAPKNNKLSLQVTKRMKRLGLLARIMLCRMCEGDFPQVCVYLSRLSQN